MMPSLVEFLTCMGVVGCGCTISDKVVYKTMPPLVLIKRDAHSASEADHITF